VGPRAGLDVKNKNCESPRCTVSSIPLKIRFIESKYSPPHSVTKHSQPLTVRQSENKFHSYAK